MKPIVLFDHQNEAALAADKEWEFYRNLMLVLPTGAGKTFVMGWFAKRCYENKEVCFIFAHRDVLISQLSDSLCKMNVPHTFIASKKTIKNVPNANLEKFGDSFYKESSTVFIVSVDTFLNKIKDPYLTNFLSKVIYWMLDEGHHLLADNKWGKCVATLKNAKGLAVTATPIRADKKGLGRHADGVIDKLIIGATQGELMERNRLSLYKIFIPPTKLNVEGLRVTASGDYNQNSLAKRTDNRDITGDAVDQYVKYANGLPAITFCVNIAHSDHVAAEFNARGIPSVSLSSKTPTNVLLKALKDFKNGVYLNLVNCDLFGEGFDVPAVVAVIMLRKTESYGLFMQQFGRCLRVSEGKYFGILIDQVGNVPRHCRYGAPHEAPVWSLDSDTLSNSDNSKPEGRVCPECFNYYTPTNKSKLVCPECEHEETKSEINDAEQKFLFNEGNLVELEIDFVNNLLKEKQNIDMPMHLFSAKFGNGNSPIKHAAINNHAKRQYAQSLLRNEIQKWCVKTAGDKWDKKTVQAKFELEFGINILRAQILSERKAFELTERIKNNGSQ